MHLLGGDSIPTNAPVDVHRLGGGGVDNLRLKPAEERLIPPGISVLKGASPSEVVDQVKRAFPVATRLHELARVVGSTTEEAIRTAGFDIMPDPTRKFPNHHRIIHPQGVAGFNEGNLARLSAVFVNTPLGDS